MSSEMSPQEKRRAERRAARMKEGARIGQPAPADRSRPKADAAKADSKASERRGGKTIDSGMVRQGAGRNVPRGKPGKKMERPSAARADTAKASTTSSTPKPRAKPEATAASSRASAKAPSRGASKPASSSRASTNRPAAAPAKSSRSAAGASALKKVGQELQKREGRNNSSRLTPDQMRRANIAGKAEQKMKRRR